ncbi:UNVERIFIED_CONTAM: hypothetical protein Sindi_0863200 [Sesamum indicum]
MAAKPLTTEAIALTEKKMDMTLDDIIKMSKTNATKPKNQRVSNRGQKFVNNAAQDKFSKARRFMDTRSSLRQGALARRRSNFQGNQFPLAAEAARKAAVAPIRNRAFNRSRPFKVNKPSSLLGGYGSGTKMFWLVQDDLQALVFLLLEVGLQSMDVGSFKLKFGFLLRPKRMPLLLDKSSLNCMEVYLSTEMELLDDILESVTLKCFMEPRASCPFSTSQSNSFLDFCALLLSYVFHVSLLNFGTSAQVGELERKAVKGSVCLGVPFTCQIEVVPSSYASQTVLGKRQHVSFILMEHRMVSIPHCNLVVVVFEPKQYQSSKCGCLQFPGQAGSSTVQKVAANGGGFAVKSSFVTFRRPTSCILFSSYLPNDCWARIVIVECLDLGMSCANTMFASMSKQPQQANAAAPKQKPQTLDSLFANMKEQRMRVLSQQTNGTRRNGGGQPRVPWARNRVPN